MTDLEKRIIACAIGEIENPEFAVTQQFFEVHKVLRDNTDVPVILKVFLEKNDTALVYFPVQGERFYFVVDIQTQPDIQVRFTFAGANYCVYLSAGSYELSAMEIEKMTTLVPTKSWSKGDKWNNGTRPFTKVMFEPTPGPGEFHDKLIKLLDYLESDIPGVTTLIAKYNGYIQVAAMYHNGNSNLGGISLNPLLIKRMSVLNIGLDFDVYAEGNLFKEEDGSWYEE